MTMNRWIAAACAALALAAGPTLAQPDARRTDAVLEWNEIMVELAQDQPPPNQNRFAAITQLAVFEAVNAVAGDHRSHLGPVNAVRGASAEAAAVSAAYRVVRSHFPDRAQFLDGRRTLSLARIPDGPAKDGGIALGEAAANATIAARANDGSEPPEFYLPGSRGPGEWQLTPDCPPMGGFFLHWRNVTPFALRRGDQFRSEPPPALTSGRYTWSYNEVKAVGARDSGERPPDRTNVVHVYAALSDAVLWNPIARQLAAASRSPLADNARTLALLNMALSDAGVAVMDTKYHYNFWRPETSIVAGAQDGNDRTEADASFGPLIAAPCFPSYPSGHATTSYAAREVLERTFGRQTEHTIVVATPAVPGVVLRYRKLAQITDDIDDARVYGGSHFRFDQQQGAEQGRLVGTYVFRHALRPVRECGCGDDEE
jgi:hypothetical protein